MQIQRTNLIPPGVLISIKKFFFFREGTEAFFCVRNDIKFVHKVMRNLLRKRMNVI
jgi:hypothetical protein